MKVTLDRCAESYHFKPMMFGISTSPRPYPILPHCIFNLLAFCDVRKEQVARRQNWNRFNNRYLDNFIDWKCVGEELG